MHGPGPHTPTNPLGWQPQYDGPPIAIVDALALTLGPLRRAFWRAGRDRGIAKWAPTGLTFTVTEELTDDRYDGPTPLSELVYPGNIRIVRQTYEPPLGSYYPESWAWYGSDGVNPKQGGLVVLKTTALWWRTYWSKAMAAVVGHELGHTLGLWHRSDSGIMAGAWNPDAHDIDSVSNWTY